MKNSRVRFILISGLILIVSTYFAVRFIIKNDGIFVYDYNKNVYIQDIPKDYEIIDNRIFVKKPKYNTIGLRLKLGDNIIIVKHKGKEKRGFLTVNHDDDGFKFSSLRFNE